MKVLKLFGCTLVYTNFKAGAQMNFITSQREEDTQTHRLTHTNAQRKTHKRKKIGKTNLQIKNKNAV